MCCFGLKIIAIVGFFKQFLLGEHGVLFILFSHNSMSWSLSIIISIYLKIVTISRCNIVFFDRFPFFS